MYRLAWSACLGIALLGCEPQVPKSPAAKAADSTSEATKQAVSYVQVSRVDVGDSKSGGAQVDPQELLMYSAYIAYQTQAVLREKKLGINGQWQVIVELGPKGPREMLVGPLPSGMPPAVRAAVGERVLSDGPKVADGPIPLKVTMEISTTRPANVDE